MKSLESLRVQSHAFQNMLAAAERSPIRRLTIDGALDRGGWDALARSPVFAALDEVDVRGNADVDLAGSHYSRVMFVRRGWAIAWQRGTDERLSALAVKAANKRAVVDDLEL